MFYACIIAEGFFPYPFLIQSRVLKFLKAFNENFLKLLMKMQKVRRLMGRQ